MTEDFKDVSNPEYSRFIALSRYARWKEEEKRRETWAETVARYVNHFSNKFPLLKEGWRNEDSVAEQIFDSIYKLEVMPSMRSLMTAGPALNRDEVSGYNCAYVSINRQRVFDEIMYILMCGTGVGFSVEKKYTQQLPSIAEEFYESDTTIIVSDSKIGWASAFRELVSLLYSGKVPRWDLSKIREAGKPLKTFGGRASGPEPLDDLFKYTVNTFRRFAGKQLPTIACHDLICKIAEIVVVGGVRRSACISLSDLNDLYLRIAKSPYTVVEYTLLGHDDDDLRKYSVIVDDTPYGERSLIVNLDDWESGELQSKHKLSWWHIHPERRLANNSVAYEDKPDVNIFAKEWTALIESYSGERGIFNREASIKQAAKNNRRDYNQDFGTNPCSEIILRDRQFCNLSEIIVRPGDTFEDLKCKARVASILGTLQSTLTNFRYLSKKWEQNTEEERLLGVSLTGIMDHPVLAYYKISPKWFCEGEQKNLATILNELKEVVIDTNKEWAEKLGINAATATTCVKPSGTVSQLVDSSSGIHPRHNPFYIRTVRGDKKDPLTQFMIDSGFPVEDCISSPDNTSVFSFPMKCKDGSVYRNDRGAIEQLELWLIYQKYWCEHKPSVTIYVKEEEWLEVAAWVWKHFNEVSGISFLPYDGGSYKQAPYQDITEEEYKVLLEKMPKDVDWGRLGEYEEEDMTTGMQEYACVAGQCEI